MSAIELGAPLKPTFQTGIHDCALGIHHSQKGIRCLAFRNEWIRYSRACDLHQSDVDARHSEASKQPLPLPWP